jgi:ABC-type polysaccharide/polyol phosphate transport system ATPase subunit
MADAIDLKFERVSKRYLVQGGDESGAGGHPWVRGLRRLARRRKEFWALRDVSFGVPRGETLGIIGHNGAGKSTVLKLLSNITAPTAGEITINGRLSALIEVGSGFHPDLTGRENIYLNGSILGMRRREIGEKLGSIADFAGITQFLDVPVKRFSSGMYVRLGFSIAAHLSPDILLLDEVLAVGDAAFQEKCLARIAELKRAGTTIVFISHDLGAVERVCDRVLLMKSGEVVKSGPPREVIEAYQTAAGFSAGYAASVAPSGAGAAEIRALSFHDAEGRTRPAFKTGDRLTARVEFEAHAHVADAVVDVLFYSPDRVVHCELTTEAGGRRLSLEPGRGVVEFNCPGLGLLPGIYYTDVTVRERGALEATHVQCGSTTLRVEPGKTVRGHFYMEHEWRVLQAEGDGEVGEADAVSLS